jgi:tripeptidyl-peptidase-2
MVLLSATERGGQTFSVQLDPSSLPPGAHFASITATDATDPSRGALFALPVTVVVPSPPPLAFRLELPPGKPARRFLSAPEAAEFAHIRIKTGAMPRGPHVVTLHAVPSARGDAPNTMVQTKRMLVLREDSEEVVVVPVRGSSTLELCLQLAWLSNPTPAAADVSVEWHSYGVRGRPTTTATALRLGAADSFARLEVSAPIRPERLKPKAELEAAERAIRPTASAVSAGSAELDVMPPSDAERRADADTPGTQIHAIELTYKFEVSSSKRTGLLRMRCGHGLCAPHSCFFGTAHPAAPSSCAVLTAHATSDLSHLWSDTLSLPPHFLLSLLPPRSAPRQRRRVR